MINSTIFCCQQLGEATINKGSPIEFCNRKSLIYMKEIWRGLSSEVIFCYCPYCGDELSRALSYEMRELLIEINKVLLNSSTIDELSLRIGQSDNTTKQESPWHLRYSFLRRWKDLDLIVFESIDGELEFLVCQSKSVGKGNVAGADNEIDQ